MTQLPFSVDALVVRTDFSSDAAWDALRAALSTPNEDDFLANVELVDDRRFADVLPEDAIGLLSAEYEHPLLILADKQALASEELPLLVIGLRAERGQRFRVVAEWLWSVENNLAISNMDFKEFASAVEDDGVLRGF
ncbi:hypothetical protein [Streptomyces sp. LBL]|uniref:DUF6924 domain-containing protein n=1 Tax=Streptomyces sp. LBL TaxID=2940562 RepID=UPI0024765C9E|nr:hypothetical protein [Streptomyces sp. LBL]